VQPGGAETPRGATEAVPGSGVPPQAEPPGRLLQRAVIASRNAQRLRPVPAAWIRMEIPAAPAFASAPRA
jgi:hypothetical protein